MESQLNLFTQDKDTYQLMREYAKDKGMSLAEALHSSRRENFKQEFKRHVKQLFGSL